MESLDILGFSHIGFVVPSIDEFRATWDDLLGIDDWLVQDVGLGADRIQLHGEIVGVDSVSRIGFAKFKGTSLELIEPGTGKSGGRAWLETHGAGMQHIGVWVRDIKVALARIEGTVEVTYSPISLRPELASRPVSAVTTLPVRPPFWAYVEPTTNQTGWTLELLDIQFATEHRATYGQTSFYPGELPGTEAIEFG